MAFSPEGQADTDLGTLFNECLDNFELLLHAVSQRNTHSSSPALKSVLIARAFDEYTRLKVWGHDFRAGLPDSTRSSLGESLRHDGELREQVEGMFATMNEQMKLAITKVHTFQMSTQEDEDDLSNSDSDTEDDEDSQQRIMSRHMKNIFNQVQLFYNLGVLLRRSGFKRAYLKSTSHILLNATPEDLSHVRESIQRWRAGGSENINAGKGVHPDDEKPVTSEELEQRANATVETNELGGLIERLARANTRRREQLMHWSEHPDQTLSLDSTRTEGPSFPQRPPDAPSDTKSVKSKNTISRSDILGRSQRPDDTQLPGFTSSRTAYAKTVVGRANATRVPNVPREARLADSFECPYCFLLLDSAPMRDDRDAWKRHVFRDLRPYTCTKPTCTNSEKLYASRHDWIYHEMQLHRRQWDCQSCQLTLFTREEMKAHLTSTHKDMCRRGNMSAVLQLYERPLDEAFSSLCPFCPFSGTTKTVLEHLGGHMEELSVFVLPVPEEEDSESETVIPGKPPTIDNEGDSESDSFHLRKPAVMSYGSIPDHREPTYWESRIMDARRETSEATVIFKTAEHDLKIDSDDETAKVVKTKAELVLRRSPILLGYLEARRKWEGAERDKNISLAQKQASYDGVETYKKMLDDYDERVVGKDGKSIKKE